MSNIDPTLIGGAVLLIAAIGIAIALALPKIRAARGPAMPGGEGFSDARDAVIDRTTKLVEKRNGRGLQNRLEASGSQLRSGEWVLLTAATTLVLAAIAFVIPRGGAIPAAVIIIFTPIVANVILNRNITKRQEAFADQLPDFLQNLSSSLRSGQSLPQAIASIAPDLESPAGDELRRVVIENRIGRDLIESFNDLADRMNSMDFDWVVRAMEINYRTGGDLSKILRRLDATIRARNKVAGKVRALSAEGRISGVVLAGLPPLVLLAVSFLSPELTQKLFGTNLGRVMLIVAGTQLLIGTIWLNNMAKFKF